MAENSDLFLFGDDLDAVLEALEGDDNVDEYFEEAVTEVQDEEISCPFCSKKCKSVGGLKRHITCKHKDEKDNDPEKESKFTNEMLAKMVEEVKRRLVNNKVFSKDIREELSAYQFTNLSEDSMEFAELQKIFKQLMKKKDQEKFYTLFYSTVPLNSTNYFTGLSRNAATLLSTKVADIMLVYSKEKSFVPVKDFEIKLSDKEMAGLQYVGGYVLHKLYNKHTKSKLCESTASQQVIAVLKAGKEQEHIMTEKMT